MTTPGQQLTPGDDQNPPEYGVPEGAYVGDAGSPNAIHDLNNLTEAEAKNRMRSQVAPSFIAQRDGVWGFFDGMLAIIQGGVNLVVGTVQAVVDGIAGIFNAIGSLFSAGRRDTAAVDQARADGERAIVAAMSDSLEHLDEVQRVGGAYMDVPTFSFDNGETMSHVVPLTEPVPLASGTGWIPPHTPLTHSTNYRYSGTSTQFQSSLRQFAGGTGQLELQESGLWLIQFQASVLQGTTYPNTPADVMCFVTAADDPYIPYSPPSFYRGGQSNPGFHDAAHRDGSLLATRPNSAIAAFGRASSYIGTRNSEFEGGNSVSGLVVAYLETGGWKVTMACTSWTKITGPMSTYVYATKLNSETLRQDIEQLKVDIAAALPGQNVPLDLTESNIAAMVSEAQGIEVPDVEVPHD